MIQHNQKDNVVVEDCTLGVLRVAANTIEINNSTFSSNAPSFVGDFGDPTNCKLMLFCYPNIFLSNLHHLTLLFMYAEFLNEQLILVPMFRACMGEIAPTLQALSISRFKKMPRCSRCSK